MSLRRRARILLCIAACQAVISVRIRQNSEFTRENVSIRGPMILILEPNTNPDGTDYKLLTGQLDRLPGIKYRVHREVGTEVTLTEIYLIGNTAALTVEQMQVLPSVQKVVRVSEAYRVLGRHQQGDDRPASFDYNGVRFGQDSLNIFA